MSSKPVKLRELERRPLAPRRARPEEQKPLPKHAPTNARTPAQGGSLPTNPPSAGPPSPRPDLNRRYRLEMAARGGSGCSSAGLLRQPIRANSPAFIDDLGISQYAAPFIAFGRLSSFRAPSAPRDLPELEIAPCHGPEGIQRPCRRRFNRARVTCNISCVATPQENSSVSNRVRNYRKRMRAQGMRPIQMWVADVRSPDFVAEAHRQAAAVAASDHAADDQAFIDAISLDDK